MGLIGDILDAEWAMFQKVKSTTPASCQSNPEAFSKIRGSIFQLWPEQMLEAYLIEITAAGTSGRNLLTEKYARMDRLIPAVNTNSLIEKIVAIETKWQAELRESYPALYWKTCRSTGSSDDGSDFSIYLSCELETYGDEVIELYYAWVSEAVDQERNFSIEMLELLVVKGGFDDLAQAEEYFKHQMVDESAQVSALP
jgi:hypothetical protein